MTISHETIIPVSVIGLGPMGQAIAQVFLNNGYPTTVWNRTAGKADALVAQRAIRATTVADALKASRLVILSLTDYNAMYQILAPATAFLPDRVLVNLSSDTPEKARQAAQWAATYDADFLTGGIMVPPPLVGTKDAYVFYSGQQVVFDQYQAALAVVGKPDYRGSDPGLAQVFYQALLDVMFTSAAGVLHAIALAQAENISPTTFEPYLREFLAFLPDLFQGLTQEVETAQYSGEENNMNMMAAGMTHVAHASRDARINTSLPYSIKKIFDQTIALGHAQNGLASLIEVLQKPSE